jgi:uncharacterized protein (TIGR02246 family)
MTETATETDLAAIQQLVADAEQYQVDPDKFLPLHTDDVVLVNIAGRRVHGRHALDPIFRKALTTPLAHVLTHNVIEDIQFLRPDVAIVSLVKHISDERVRGPELPDRGALTYVLTKEDETWRIALAHTTPIKG